MYHFLNKIFFVYNSNNGRDIQLHVLLNPFTVNIPKLKDPSVLPVKYYNFIFKNGRESFSTVMTPKLQNLM